LNASINAISDNSQLYVMRTLVNCALDRDSDAVKDIHLCLKYSSNPFQDCNWLVDHLRHLTPFSVTHSLVADEIITWLNTLSRQTSQDSSARAKIANLRHKVIECQEQILVGLCHLDEGGQPRLVTELENVQKLPGHSESFFVELPRWYTRRGHHQQAFDAVSQ